MTSARRGNPVSKEAAQLERHHDESHQVDCGELDAVLDDASLDVVSFHDDSDLYFCWFRCCKIKRGDCRNIAVWC